MQLNELASLLIELEKKFSSVIDDIPVTGTAHNQSIQKPEIIADNSYKGLKMMQSGCRYGHAETYSSYLKRFIDENSQFNIAVVGTSRGQGLAIFNELFPYSVIYGFDQNSDDTKNNIPNLKKLGAFSKNEPILYELDKQQDNTLYLQKIFRNDKISICINDGFHSNETILKSFKSFLPFLAENFVYFIDDNADVHKELIKEYPELSIEVDGELTIVYRNVIENLVDKVSKPFSVMFISHSSALNGAERCLFDLATKFVKRGIECCIILHEDGPLKKLCNLNGVPVYIIPASGTWWCKLRGFGYNTFYDLSFFNMSENIRNYLLPLVKDLHSDIIYSQTVVKPIGGILAQMAGIPHVVSAREYGDIGHPLNFRFGLQKSMKALYDDSDVIFTVTNDVRDNLFGKDAKKTLAVLASISIEDTKSNKRTIEYRAININMTVKLLILAGIQEIKAQLDAVRACKILMDKGYNVELSLCGDYEPKYIKLIRTFINENNLSKYVKIMPFDSNNFNLIYDTDIVLSCCGCESLGRTMLEAALLKRPFIYAKGGGPKEIFIEDFHALAYNFGDYKQLAEKIIETIEEPLSVEARVETAYTYVKANFNDHRYVDTQINAIENMLTCWEKRNESACAKLIENSMLQFNGSIIISTRGYRVMAIARKLLTKIFPKGSKRRTFAKYVIYVPIKLVYKFGYSVYRFGITTTVKKIFHKFVSLWNNSKVRSILHGFTVANIKAFIHSIKNDGFKYSIRKAYQKLGSDSKNLNPSFNAKNLYMDSTYILDGVKYFDREYYYRAYPDVKLAGLDALQHYLSQGWKEDRKPSENFSTFFYKSEYKDYLSENENPLIHYLRYGKKKGFFINFEKFTEGVSDSKLKTIRRKLSIRPHFHNYYTTITLDETVKSKKIAIHLHLYYEDMQAYFINKLNNLKVNFTLFISVSEKSDAVKIYTTFVDGLQHANDVIVEKVQNQGRDIAPFIITFGKRLLKFDYICHIHSKKSPQHTFKKDWKDEIVHNLLGSVSIVNQNLNLLADDGKVVFNEPNLMVYLHNSGWSDNYDIARVLLQKHLDTDIEEYGSVDFPQGSMFWAKAEALKEFLSLPLTYNDFPKEPIDVDGTIAHALERLVLIFTAKYKGIAYCIYKENSPTSFYRYEDKFDFSKFDRKDKNIKILSYYLPQFDTNPINDKYHGKGFTEWTKVSAAQPLFYGHYQQHIPHKDIGYYHLTSPEILEKQATMMKHAGVYGQIFYHYWFSGTLILEKPAQILLTHKYIDMPFCFCWANENWTKKWDGNDAETILEQKYSQSDAKDFIHYLIPFFKDDRYIKVDGRPVLYIYRVSSFPNFHEYKKIWEEECIKAGLQSPFLVATLIRGITSPIEYGMDAAVERAPYDWGNVSESKIDDQIETYKEHLCNVFDYDKIADHYSSIDYNIGYPVYKSLLTIWDNTARYGEKAYIVHNSTPERFQEWLHNLISYSKAKLPENQQFIIVNAWNEWAEAAHLEPDEKFGYAYLNSIGRELFKVSSDIKTFTQGGDVVIDKKLNVGISISNNDNKLLEDENSFFSKSLKISSIFNKCNVFINPEKVCDLNLKINGNGNDFGLHSMCLENIVKMALRNQCAQLEAFNFSYNIKYVSGETLAIENYWQAPATISLKKDFYKINKVPSNTIIYDIDETFKAILEKANYNNTLDRKVIIIIDHSLGGGTAFYVDSKIDEILSRSYVLRIQYARDTGLYTATFYYNDEIVFTTLSDISTIVLIEHYFEIENVIINSLVYYEDIEKTVDFIKALKNDHIKITYMLHDFYALCPQYNLLDSNGSFCNFRLADDKKLCNDCISILLESNQNAVLVADITKCASINKWHKIFKRLLSDTVDNIIVFSENSFNIIVHAFPNIAYKTTIVPHKTEPLRKVKIPSHKSINIGIIGTMAFHKGSQIVNEISDIILKRDLCAKIFVIGNFVDKNNGINITGKYERKNLPAIVEKLQIDIIFISSITAETFSYTTSEAISMGLPIACFNLGAQAEKVSKYKKGLVISKIDASTALDEIISFMGQKEM